MWRSEGHRVASGVVVRRCRRVVAVRVSVDGDGDGDGDGDSGNVPRDFCGSDN